MRIAIITAAPTPFRDPVHAMVSQFEGDEVTLIYCSYKEPIREWNLESPIQNAIFLKENYIKKKDGINFIHSNPDVFKHLKRLDPDVVVTTGFAPTYLMSWLYATTHRKKHITFVDGWKHSESFLTTAHRVIRKMVFAKTHAFVGPGINSAELYKSYGAKEEQIFISRLCANNELFTVYHGFEDRKYDLMFAGRFHKGKRPSFFIEVVSGIQQVKPNVSVLLIGGGPMEREVLQALEERNIHYHFPGFIQPNQLPYYYSSARLLLFPTENDAWGLVGNEALASGTPVLVTPYAGLVNDLVIDGHNGFINDFDAKAWIQKAHHLLSDRNSWNEFSLNGLKSVRPYNYYDAAKGLFEACKYAFLN